MEAAVSAVPVTGSRSVKTPVGHGLPFGVDAVQRINLFVRGIRRYHLRNEPCGPVGVGIELRFQPSGHLRNDEIARVEHVVDLHVHRYEMPVDEVLIALQFGTVVSSDGAVEVGGRGVAEGVHRKVGHPISRCGIFQYLLVRLRGIELRAPCRNEVVPREVAQVYGNEVEADQPAKHAVRMPRFIRPFGIEQHEAGRDEDEEQRAPGVGAEHLRRRRSWRPIRNRRTDAPRLR